MKKFMFALMGGGIFLAGFFLFSCSSGLGESIDLEAPVLEITSPSHGQFVPKTFTLSGIATDNKKVKSVEIEYKYKKNGETISDKSTAILNGEKWECEFSFDGDYEVEFEAFAYDALKNGSDTSHQRIMLLIDSQDPETDKMSIVRGDYVARLYPLEEFTKPGGITEQKDDPKNKDNFQNEEITLVTTLNDNYGIGHISLDLYEVNPDTKAETLVVKDIEPDSTDNKYSPRFTIKEDMLPTNIRTGLHYLRPHLTAEDIATNQTYEVYANVFAWETEYNTPHVTFGSMQSDGHLLLQKGAPVIATIFDDDKIKSCYYSNKLVKDENSASLDGELKFETGSRDLSFEISTDDLNIGSYYFAVKVEDETSGKRSDGTYYKIIPVTITNAEAPVIIVDSPEENSAPVLENGIFTIEGKVADNEENLNKIAIAWLPNGNDDISKAEKFFQSYAFDTDKTYDGIKIYKLPVKSTEKKTENIIYYSFAKEFDFFNDFIVNGKVHNENKVFMIAAKDPTENVVTSTFRLSKISSAPKFKVGYTNSETTVKPAENLMFTPLANKVTTFTIKPFSESNLKITEFSVTGNDNGKNILDSNKTGDAITIDFNTDEANLGKVYRYTLSATDQIGGTQKETLTIQFDQFGVLTSITCNTAESHIFKGGETIRLQANFDYKVYVNGDPYILISGNFTDKNGKSITVPEDQRRAVYKSGSNSNTLYFECEVPEGVECNGFTIGKIQKNGATLEGDIDGKDGKYDDQVSGKYNIDSIEPFVKEITMGTNNNNVVEKGTGTSVTINFVFNEEVTVESGTIIIQRVDNWYIPPVLSETVFLKIFNEKANDDKIKEALCGTANLADNSKYIENTLMPAGPYMQYTNGIKEGTGSKAGSMVPDLDTKFVLAYEYNIGDTDEKTTTVRKALEDVGYHKAEIDASRMTPKSTKTTSVALEIKDSDFIDRLVNGVDYNILFTNFKVYDRAYNYNTDYQNTKHMLKIDDKEYEFWVGPVATPVIRVNRTATNDTELDGKTHNPFTTGGVAQTTFKIDCETPNAKVLYGTASNILKNKISRDYIQKINTNEDDYGKTWYDKRYGQDITEYVDDITPQKFGEISLNDTISELKGSEESKAIGSLDDDISEKYYIRAKSEASNNMEASTDYAKEGAFKTVIHYYLNYSGGDVYKKDWSKDDNGNSTKHADSKFFEGEGTKYKIRTPLRIHGAQIPEGSSYTAGWPLTQNGNARSDYQIAFADEDKHFYWVSWQILDDYCLQVYATNFQEPANTGVTYGMYHYGKNINFYGTLHYDD